MNKRITNKSVSNKTPMTTQKRIAISGGFLVGLLSLSSLFIVGFSVTAVLLFICATTMTLSTYVIHHITSGAYLPQQQEKSLRQKLISLKFKLSNDHEKIIERAIEIEKKVKTNQELLETVLKKFFNPGEVTYQRYYETGMNTLNAINANLELITNKLMTLQKLDNEQNKEVILKQVNESINHTGELFDSFESLIMSFEACDVSHKRDEIFEQLEELSKRTKKYMDI